ncbi:MAG TPA: DNA translocase FtsK 4TM domain-containing protein, partial [Bryobacteraceae bacterium]|nr:DNA translocase FtsK 4TM domain-containing protein [Bryobacteraceae bacterium]
MKVLSPSQHPRLNEVTGFLLLSLGLVVLLSLVSYHAQDPSWDTAASARPHNLVGYPGSYIADLLYQAFGIAAFLFPLLIFLLSWKWIRSEEVEAGAVKVAGTVLLCLGLCTSLSFTSSHLFRGTVRIGGTVGFVVGRWLLDSLNLAGALVATGTAVVVSVYLVSSFTISRLNVWAAWFRVPRERWQAWRERRRQRAREKTRMRRLRRAEKRAAAAPVAEPAAGLSAEPAAEPGAPPDGQAPPWDESEPAETEVEEEAAAVDEIPICPVEELPPAPAPIQVTEPPPPPMRPVSYRLPPTALLNEVPGRNPYDEQELKDTALRIKAKFAEFNVLGTVVQINPGPVVTTFEFKPEAGIKYSRIINLTEDLCLGLQAESILIERIPGRPTVGLEVPNSRREIIALRQMLESEEFAQSHSRLTIPLGKDINGRIKVTSLDAMPHLLIAGSTGSGKSVMINSMIMGILYKSTPDEVRMIMVDPKRVELGMYEGIPHLLTPVITDPRKATNALRNAVLEMERRLRLLAEYGVRNIDQFNKKIRKLQEEPRSLFADQDETADDLRPLPYILVLIDELADLMMLEGRNVEESVTRLAQMA